MPGQSPQAVLEMLAGNHQLSGFVDHGRLRALPSKRSKRLMLLDTMAQVFEPGIRYPEPLVNELLSVLHPDYAALRRYLVDEQLMDRAGGEYWRIGGTVGPYRTAS